MSFTEKERKLLLKHNMLKKCERCDVEVALSMPADKKMRVMCSKHVGESF